jgi:peptidyl-prolyl cis-trans isomerase A (cyclophilin A)
VLTASFRLAQSTKGFNLTTKACIRKAVWIYIAAFLLLAFTFHAEAKTKSDKTKVAADKKGDSKMTTVVMETSLGTIEIELNGEKAPESTKNFLSYVDDKFYDGTIFHRVISTFMIQGGGFTESFDQKKTKAPIKNESKNGLKNEIGTIAMARTNDPDSATAQFFINVKDNDFLNNGPGNPGYAVFGKVTSGMDVVTKIKDVPTTSKGMYDDVPKTAVVIKSIHRK